MTHYETLGLNKNATQEEIKKAYKDLVKKYHPDIYKGDKEFALKKTQEINEAYDVLSNETSKAEYDESLNPNPTTSYTSDTNYSYHPNETQYSYTPPTYDEHNNSYTKYDDINEMYKRHYQTYSTKTHSSTIPNINNYNPEDEEIVFSKKLRQLATKIVTKKSIFITAIIFFVIYFIYLLIHLSDIFSGNASPAIIDYKTYNPDLNPNYVQETEDDDSDDDKDSSSHSNYKYIYEEEENDEEDIDSSDEDSITDDNDSNDEYSAEEIYNILFGTEDESEESSEEETEVVTPSNDNTNKAYDIRDHLGTTYEEADEYLRQLYTNQQMNQLFDSYDDFITYLNKYYSQYGEYNYFSF